MKKSAGFTAVEFAIVLVVIFTLVTLVATSLPIISRILGVYRVKASAEGLGTRFNLARQESARKARSTIVFIDQNNSRVFIDLNQNGKPEGFKNADVLAGRITNEEYDLPKGVILNVRASVSTCFGVPAYDPNKPGTSTSSLLPAPPPELGISSYSSANWKSVVFDSRGELQLTYRTEGENENCIITNLDSSQTDPSGAVLVYCLQDANGPTRYSISVSLRGGVSVLTYKNLPSS
jgi:Tfp pilus assembly protein FimT